MLSFMIATTLNYPDLSLLESAKNNANGFFFCYSDLFFSIKQIKCAYDIGTTM